MVDRINLFFRGLPVWVVYLLLALPAPYLFYLAASGQLGLEPVETLEHRYGEIALQLLIAGLAITPVRRFAGINLLKFRRAIGVTAFFYVVAHVLVWAVLDVQALDRVWADIVKRPYITIGMVGFVLMIPLTLTSNNLSIRRLGAKWRSLHKATYAVAVLGAVHFVMVGKGIQLEPLTYLLVILALLGMRTLPNKRASRGTMRAA